MAVPLSIIVCTHNHADSLDGTLRHLRAQVVNPSAFEVVVVNNGCTDRTPAVVAAAGYREVFEPTPGQVHARSRGVTETQGEWIAFVDDDNLLDPDWVAAVLRFIAAHPGCGAFGGKVEIDWEIPPPPAVASRAYAYAATDLGGDERRLAGNDRWRLRGAGLVCRRQALRDAGWLDWRANVGRAGGQGTMAGDDTEIIMRIARAGWELWYAPACRLVHVIGQHRLTVSHLRSLHHGFAVADPILLGFQERGSLLGWAGRFTLLLARRVYWLGRHSWRGRRDADARLTARLTLDTLRGNLRGLLAAGRLGRTRRREWLEGTSVVKGEPARSPLRVLHLHRGLEYGGLERMLLCLGVDRAACAWMEPTFGLGHRERLARELAAAGARVEILGETSFRHPWQTVGTLRRLRRLVRRESFDVVVCHGSSALAFFGGGVWNLGVPVVLWMHSDSKVRNKNLVEWLAGRVRPVLAICNSAHTAASLPLLFTAPPPHVVIPCPVTRPATVHRDRDPERRHELRVEFDTASDAVVIILPSRLEEWKGHGVLLDALGQLRALPTWQCWIVGGPFDATQENFLRRLHAQAAANGIADRVRFVGQREDVPDLLKAADIFCQPNLTPEPFGVNVVEALYAGLPVVASDSGGTREIVDATCGRLLVPGDVAALSTALDRLIRDAALRHALGAGAMARGDAVSSPDRLLPILGAQLTRLTPRALAAAAISQDPNSWVQREVLL